MGRGARLSLAEPGGLRVGSWGTLEVVDRQHLGLRTPAGSLVSMDAGGLFEEGTNLVGWFEEEFDVALLAVATGTRIVRLDLAAVEVAVAARLDREPDEDLRFLSFHGIDEAVIALFERGVVCFEPDGRLRWQAAHDDLSAEFQGVRGGAAWFGSQWPPDRVGYRFAFRLSDGVQVFG